MFRFEGGKKEEKELILKGKKKKKKEGFVVQRTEGSACLLACLDVVVDGQRRLPRHPKIRIVGLGDLIIPWVFPGFATVVCRPETVSR